MQSGVWRGRLDYCSDGEEEEQLTLACDEEITTLARPLTVKCRAFTKTSALVRFGALTIELICSLTISDPISKGTV